MKLITKYCIFVWFSLIAVTTSKHLVAQSSGVSFQVFYDNLSPYGHWVDYPDYGYIWIPSAGSDFVPYSTSGHWVMTDYGWTWASAYDWGWAPFHYGRWNYDNYYGWFWVPDNIWGPAWVVWRSSPGYYGWAPLGPNVSISYAMGGGYNPAPDYWCFVSNQYMGREDINNYYGPRKSNPELINNSTIINNTYIDNSRNTTYIAGPRKEEIEKVTGRKLMPVDVKDNSKPGQAFKNNELHTYRPLVSPRTADARPPKISDKKDIRPASEIKGGEQLNNPGNKRDVPAKSRAIQPARKTQEQNIPRQKEQRPVMENKQGFPKAKPEINRSPVPENKQQRNIPQQNEQRPVPENRQAVPQTRPQINQVTVPENTPQPVQRENAPVPENRQAVPQIRPEINSAPVEMEVPRQAAPEREPPVQQPPRQQSPQQEPQKRPH